MYLNNAYKPNKEKHRRQRGVYYLTIFKRFLKSCTEKSVFSFLTCHVDETEQTECMSLEMSVTSTSSCNVCFQVNLYSTSRVWTDMMHHVSCNVSAKPKSVEKA